LTLRGRRLEHEKLPAHDQEDGMDERNEQDEPQVDQETLKDLDVDQDDADKVSGGVRRAADPDEGGE
jgi:hypothetical protein